MIHTLPLENADTKECLQLSTPSIFQNNIMSLNLVLTFQPWFTKLMKDLSMVQIAAQNGASLESELNKLSVTNIDTSNLLSILGYCPCEPDQSHAVKLVSESNIDEKENFEVSHLNHKDNITSCCGSKHLNSHKDCTEEEDLRKDDEYLLDLHPHEAKYFTNPKTGRKVKKLVCLLSGWGKIFEKKWNFKDHIRMHMGQKPYNCKMCDKSFTQKGNLAKHLRQHDFSDLKSRKVHQCQICHKKFTEKYNLKVRNISSFTDSLQ